MTLALQVRCKCLDEANHWFCIHAKKKKCGQTLQMGSEQSLLSEPQLPREPCPASPIKQLPHMVSLFLSLRFMIGKIMMIFRDHILKLKWKQAFFLCKLRSTVEARGETEGCCVSVSISHMENLFNSLAICNLPGPLYAPQSLCSVARRIWLC